ncbi:MAG: alpha/beta fold hydrolase, partial [Gammaproteobacteria bacterium]
LIDRGLPVYLLDWGEPDAAYRHVTLDDLICGRLHRCLDAIRADAGVERINLMGICQGGVFSLCYAALQPERIGALLATVTPVDFHTADDLLSRLVRHIDIDRAVDVLGNVPGELLNSAFLALKPFSLGIGKYRRAAGQLDATDYLAEFARLEQWIEDSPAQPGEVFRRFVRDFYQRNALLRGELLLDGRRVDLARITMPVLNVVAAADHLVPPAASRALAAAVGSDDYSEVELPGGHIGIYVAERARSPLAATIDNWLAARAPRPTPIRVPG